MDVAQLILDCLPADTALDAGSLQYACGVRLGTAVKSDEFEPALSALVDRGDVVISGRLVRRNEPDFPEAILEDAIASHLQSPFTMAELGVAPTLSVFHVSARGGAAGSGQFSRPDFTLATIRTRKYDPLRYLDVITFELKNLAGTSLLAVHETLAHTRFAHYSYLVCPRPTLRPDRIEAVQNACAELGVGLATFVIQGPSGPPRLGEFGFVIHPKRKNPDPGVVEKYLEDRMPADKLARLACLARTG